MMNKKWCTIYLFLLFPIYCFAQNTEKSLTYNQLDSLVNFYYQKGEIKRTIEILENAKSQYPENKFEIINDLLFLYRKEGQMDNLINTYEYGQKQGFYFEISADNEIHKQSGESERYKKFILENEKKIENAQKDNKAVYSTILPENYDSTKKYPLFIAMHGRSGSNSIFMNRWKLNNTADKVILAFLQSSQISGMKSYVWDIKEQSRTDVTNFYKYLLKNYDIDEGRVIIGGFSQGGTMSLDAAFNNVIPVKGFITLCPVMDLAEVLDTAAVRRVARSKIRGITITGEKDQSFLIHRLAEKSFKQNGLEHRLVIVPGLGHRIPKNISELLDEAIEYILNDWNRQ